VWSASRFNFAAFAATGNSARTCSKSVPIAPAKPCLAPEADTGHCLRRRKDIAAKNYVVRLSADERGRLEEFVGKGKPAGASGDESAYFVKGRRFGGGRRLKRQPASLYSAFPAAQAQRLAERFEWRYTPKHGSWLDMAESELAVLVR
jgi:hypothetical protein